MNESYFIKKRKLSELINWIDYGEFYTQCHLDYSVELLTSNKDISFRDAVASEKEKQNALKFFDEYNEFLNELNDIEKEIVKHIRRNNPLLGVSDERYKELRNNVYIKWCRKFMPSEIIYIHEIDMNKFAKEIRQARLDKHYTIKSIAEFLLISESTIRSYETGRRLPRLNVLYALLKIYVINIDYFCSLIFR